VEVTQVSKHYPPSYAKLYRDNNKVGGICDAFSTENIGFEGTTIHPHQFGREKEFYGDL
jgi:hypothetical protein